MKTKTNATCLISMLLILMTGKLSAQELLFGSGPMPKVIDESLKAQLADNGQSWKIPISRKGISRLIQIVGLGSEKNITATLVCSSNATPMQNMAWMIAQGNCMLNFMPESRGAVTGEVKLTIVAAALESGRIGDSVTADLVAKANQNQIKVALTLKGGPPIVSKNSSSGQSGLAMGDLFRPAILILAIALVAVTILFLFLLKHNKHRRQVADEIDGRRSITTAHMAPEKPPLQTLSYRQESASRIQLPAQETAVEKTQKEHSKQILDLQSKLQSLEVQIQGVADQCIAILSENREQTANQMLDIRKNAILRVYDAENKIIGLQKELSEHLSSQSSKLQHLFKDLPALAELDATDASSHASELSQLEGQLVAAAKQGALPPGKVEALQAECSGLMDAIQRFASAAAVGINKDQSKKRLARIFESVKVLHNELANLSQLATAQKHGFFVELSLLEQNSLAHELAAALTREVMKLKDPENYYQKRLAVLKAHVCASAINLADLDLDAERRNSGLQDSLANLLQTLGIAQIDPHQNDTIQASEHQVAQFVRRTPGAIPGTIAHTLVRGLRRGSEVICKASVLLYE